MYRVAAHIMDKRIDSMNMTTIDIAYEPMQAYINKKRKEGINISHMALIIAAYLRTVSEFPELNRFVVNKKIYARNEIAVSMVVLKGSIMDHGTMSKMYFTPDNNGTEKMIKFLLSVPGVLPVGVALFKFLDKHGLLPKFIIDMSPFHSSLLISNLASIRTNHIYHHVYEFGTTSIGITIGTSREIAKRKGGEIEFVKCMPMGVVMDERICSGSYFALAFRRMKQFLKEPALLEVPPETITPDPNLKIKK